MATIISNKKPSISLNLWAARLAWQLARQVRMWGLLNLLSIPLALFALALFWHSHHMQTQQKQIELASQQAQAKRTMAQQAKPQVDPASADLARQIGQFYAFLPSHDALPDQIKRLLANAEKHGLQLAQADYKAIPQANLAMLRYQIVLPVKADYPKIALFLQSALQEMPSLTLESMQLKRGSIEATEVEARLQLVLLVQAKRAKQKVANHE